MRRAQLVTLCERCDIPIAVGTLIKPHGGGWIHLRCAPGGDDE